MSSPTPSSHDFHPLTLAAVEPLTDEAVTLAFELPEGLSDTFQFTPGQYLTLRANIDGEDVRRSYSICSPVGGKQLRVGIKRLNGGAFSNFARDLKPGDQIQVMPPQGRFTAPLGGTNSYLLLAAGSGITPMMSIAASVLENEPDSQVTLLFGNRNTASIMFREQLEDLKDRFMTRFTLMHLLARERQELELFNGRLNGDKLATLQERGLLALADYNAAYICGPAEMIEGCRDWLTDQGLDKTKIKTELFTPAPGSVARAAQTAPVDHDGAATQVQVMIDGSTRVFDQKPGEAYLDAAKRNGVEVPFSCANGMCATCRCQVVEGEAEMKQNFSLEDWEVESGFILSCQLVPKSETLVLDYDAL